MFETILMIIATIAMIGYIIVSLLPEKTQHKSYKVCHPIRSEKWVFLPSKGLFLVKGDFWVGYNPKAEMPYQIINVDFVLYEFKTKEEMSVALLHLSMFMENDTKKVFHLESYDDLWR